MGILNKSILDRHKYRIVKTDNNYMSYRSAVFSTWISKNSYGVKLDKLGIRVVYIGIA